MSYILPFTAEPRVTLMSASPKAGSLTFRLEPALKAALAASAAEQRKQPAELMRELIRAHVEQRRRRTFEEEARRQCAIINQAAQDPHSDEAQIMRELVSHLEDIGNEWK